MTGAADSMPGAGGYPLVVTIPAGLVQRRWSAPARPLLSIPALVLSVALNIGAAFAVWATAVAVGRVPGWLYDFQLTVLQWHTRSVAYVTLLTENAPPRRSPRFDVTSLDQPGWRVGRCLSGS